MTRQGSAAAIVAGLGLGLVSTALSALAVAVVILPQRLAQQPAGEGVLALHLDARGNLRLWNRPIRAQELLEGLRPPAQTGPPGAVLRLIPDQDVPWGLVRQAAAGLESTGLPLELQLP